MHGVDQGMEPLTKLVAFRALSVRHASRNSRWPMRGGITLSITGISGEMSE